METEELLETINPDMTILTDTGLTDNDMVTRDTMTLHDVTMSTSSLLKSRQYHHHHHHPVLHVQTVQFHSTTSVSSSEVEEDLVTSSYLENIKSEPQDSDDGGLDGVTCTTIDFGMFGILVYLVLKLVIYDI